MWYGFLAVGETITLTQFVWNDTEINNQEINMDVGSCQALTSPAGRTLNSITMSEYRGNLP